MLRRRTRAYNIRIRIAIISAHNNAAGACLRSLARAGHWVILAGLAGQKNFLFRSRYCRNKRLVPDPSEDMRGFLAAVEEIEADALLPCSEPTAMALAGNRRAIGPGHAVMLMLSDKLHVAKRAREFGIPTPDSSESEEFIRERWPVFLKSRMSHMPKENGFVKGTRWAPTEPDEAVKILRDNANLLPIAQERVNGEAWGISLLMWGGRARAGFAHRRIREVPASGGPSSAAESIPMPADTLKRLEAWLADEGFAGLAMCEFKGDYLIEVNPRPWGSLPLAIVAGIDFPRLLVDCWAGNPPEGLPAYRVGVKAHWLKGELSHLASCENFGNTLKSFFGIMRPWPIFNFGIDDPMPALWEIVMSVSGAWDRPRR
ncbi:MAG: hypothetical protein ACP5QG_02205 [candidate division WOR-3 bacterium]